MCASVCTKIEKALLPDTQFCDEFPQVAEHEVAIKYIVARGDWRVCGEYGTCRHRFNGGSKFQATGDQFPDSFNDLEGRVTLVDVPDTWTEPGGPQCPDAGDAENHLLPKASLAITAVELPGDLAVVGFVAGQISIEQQYRYATNFRPPGLDGNLPALEIAMHDDLVTGRILHGTNRGVVGLDVAVPGNLLAVFIDPLIEISLPVKQSDSYKRQAEVARRLAMVARIPRPPE
jgi:hypothetical protein